MTRSNLSWVVLVAALGCHDGAATDKPSPTPSASGAPAVSATATASAPPADPLAVLAAGPSLREATDVMVDGVKETWRLEWTSPPVPDCVDDSFSTCACAGFAYGEKGDLDLVRARPGQPDERLHLGPLFEGGKARLQRWPVGPKPPAKPASLVELSMRPLAHAMKLADYDHDGRATELVLQLGASACGHTPSVVVGISKSKPTLHVFGTSEKPTQPLELDRRADWDALAAKSSVTVVEVACGDHGADTETSIELSANGELHAKDKTRKCP
jgi:hypothetical protein